MNAVCPVYNLFKAVQDTPPVSKEIYLELLPILNTISPFQTFLTTGLHQIKADEIIHSGFKTKSRKLHIDFIPFERLDIRVVELDGEIKYFVSSRADHRLKDPDRWIM
jgi:hypothetical protein